MPKGPRGEKRPADMNQLAKMIVDLASGQRTEELSPRGRPGGLRGGKARAEKLTAEERAEIARKAVAKRWTKHRPS